MSRRLVGSILASVVIAAVAVAGATGSRNASPLRVGYGFGFDANDGPDRVGFEKLAKDYGTTAKLEDMGSPPEAIVALARGRIDLLKIGLVQVVAAVAGGVPIEAVLEGDTRPDFFVVARPGITSVKQLRGKSLVVSAPQTTTSAFATRLVERAGLRASDVSFPAVRDSSGRVAALLHGRADAAVLDEIDTERIALSKRGYHVLGRIAQVQPPGPASVWAVSTRFAKAHPQEVQHVVSSLLAGFEDTYTPAGRARFVREDRAGLLKGDDPRLAGRVYDWYRAAGFWPRPGSSYSAAAYAKLVRYWRANDALDAAPPPFARVWDMRFWRAG